MHLSRGISSKRMTRREVFACWNGKGTHKSASVSIVNVVAQADPPLKSLWSSPLIAPDKKQPRP